MKSEFLDPLKLSNIVPVQKKEDPTDKTNYRPNSVLSLLSKIFENVMYEQLYYYLKYYSNDFRKALPTQYVFSRLIQSLKKGLYNSGLVRTIAMDLSKVFHCLSHDPLKTKLDAYGLDKSVLIWLMATYAFGNKGKKLALRIMTGLTLLGVFHRNSF